MNIHEYLTKRKEELLENKNNDQTALIRLEEINRIIKLFRNEPVGKSQNLPQGGLKQLDLLEEIEKIENQDKNH